LKNVLNKSCRPQWDLNCTVQIVVHMCKCECACMCERWAAFNKGGEVQFQLHVKWELQWIGIYQN